MTLKFVFLLLLSSFAPSHSSHSAFSSSTGSPDGSLDSCSSPANTSPVLSGIDIISVYDLVSNGTVIIPSSRMGSADFSYHDDEGFLWYFENEANMEKYKSKSDDEYMVGAGGYCALAVSGADPACDYSVCQGPACLDSSDTVAIYDDKKIYFFLGKGARNIFEEDLDTNLENAKWAVDEVEGKNEVSCFNSEIFRCQ
ncbi:hypothetical protein TrST_g3265 [Triparma strigata]|uniref:Uncharacterized protein n=2 Tax=Triparma TaxID=722752 RepID=A0A9W7EX93_9STRA|nr:hypothetical protein TrST_g3265 [Triparma strigata]